DDRYRDAAGFNGALAGRPVSGPASTEAARPTTEPGPRDRPAPTVIRSELPDGGALTVTLDPGGAKPGKLTVAVREAGPKKRRRLRDVCVTVVFATLLLAAVPLATAVVLLPHPATATAERPEMPGTRLVMVPASSRGLSDDPLTAFTFRS